MITLELIYTACLPVAVTTLLCLFEENRTFGKMNNRARQLIIGVVFGLSAVCATEFGINLNGAIINVRDAAPVCAGLIFGPWAGIISGIIGGLERLLAVNWGAGEFTAVACFISTVLAGFIAALLRRVIFNDKTPSWLFALFTAVVIEIIHMLMVFLTNMSEISRAFDVVTGCFIPMVTLNGLSVAFAALISVVIRKEKIVITIKERKIANIVQGCLLITVMTTFVVTGLWTYSIQTGLAENRVKTELTHSIEDIKSAFTLSINDYLRTFAYQTVYYDLGDNMPSVAGITKDNIPDSNENGKFDDEDINDYLCSFADAMQVKEINVVSPEGIIVYSNVDDYIGFDMAKQGEDNLQARDFYQKMQESDYYLQEYQATSFSQDNKLKYAGIALTEDCCLAKKGGFVQVGYTTNTMKELLEYLIPTTASSRRVGKNGTVYVCYDKEDEKGGFPILGKTDGSVYEDKIVENKDDDPKEVLNLPLKKYNVGECFTEIVDGEPHYCLFQQGDGYYVVVAIPEKEAMLSGRISILIIIFIEFLVFVVLFVLIDALIKLFVVNNIQKVNQALSQISDGNLDVEVDVYGCEEFTSLSRDINTTVLTLKRYIAEAEARIDKELEFARSIQHSALPSVFPPYPSHTEFDIFAGMYTAKEVGGDFYDFYLIGEDRLAFAVADVSGKGIPAAMFMMTAKTLLKSYAESGLSLDEVFENANEKLCQGNDAGMFVTAWMGILDINTGNVQFVNAGHNPPVIRRKGGSFEFLKQRANFVLAGMEGIKYQKYQLQLEKGDEIFLYTDGVTEANNEKDELYGDERLLNLLNSSTYGDAKELCGIVKTDVDCFAGKAPQFDDITMLSLKYRGGKP